MKKFAAISVGDTAEVVHTITENDVKKFVDLSGDDNKLHTDGEFARQTSLRMPVVHGMLGVSFISTVIGTKLPGDGALWFSQSLEFISPVRVGDEIRVVARVIDKIPRDSVIVLSTEIFNQDKQKVTTGTAKVRLVQLDDHPNAKEPTKDKRTAVVIGAGGGVGSAVARSFAAQGIDLVLTYRGRAARLEALKDELSTAGLRVTPLRCDATQESDVAELRAACERALGRVDYVVNTATAPIATVAIADLDWRDFEAHLAASAKSSFLLAKNLAPLMVGRTSPCFVFISSQAADAPVPGWMPYVTGKSALNGMARSLAIELAPMGIRVNMVAPGMIDTDLIANVSTRARLMVEAKSLRRRLAMPRDVAAAVTFLCSDVGDYITGETVRVNGGQVML
jgi:3-oxoacyl-[acyl-carrier protein] reductase